MFNWEFFISWRYLTAKRKERFISLISLISVLGIAVGVMALIVVIAVMNGFDQELREKVVSINPHILIESQPGITRFEEVLRGIEDTGHIVAAAPFINGQALMKSEEEVVGVLLRGIDPEREIKVTKIEQYMKEGTMELTERDILIGSELAQRLYLHVGDTVSIISSARSKNLTFRIAGIFTSGMYEYDLNLALTSIKAAQNIFNLPGSVSGIGVRLDDLYQAKGVRDALQKKLGYSYWVRDWMSLNRNLFSALKLEKTTMFIIVTLIVVVACFNIAGTLIMMVMEKTKDIGILKAIGATNGAVKRIFTIEGLIIGLSGTAIGTMAGMSLCYFLKTYKFITLPRDVYYIESLPVEMRWVDSLAIVASALVISLLATLYPARQAARLNPSETLRYE